jgi:anti-sigma B factor antagonist
MPISNTSGVWPASAPACAISRRELDGRIIVVSAVGELDLSSAPELKWALAGTLDEERRQVVLDLSNVTFLDSTALGVLVGVQRRLSRGTHLAIVCEDAHVLGIFELSGLLSMFELFSTLELALQAARANATEPG